MEKCVRPNPEPAPSARRRTRRRDKPLPEHGRGLLRPRAPWAQAEAPPATPARRRVQSGIRAVVGSMTVRTSLTFFGCRKIAPPGVPADRGLTVGEVDAKGLVVHDELLRPRRLAGKVRKRAVGGRGSILELLAIQIPDSGQVTLDHIAFHAFSLRAGGSSVFGS